MPCKCRLRRARGFTLIEILVALTVVALALGAALGSVATSVRGHQHARLSVLATWLAADVRTELMLSDRQTTKSELVYEKLQWGHTFQVSIAAMPAQTSDKARVTVSVLALDDPRMAPVILDVQAETPRQ